MHLISVDINIIVLLYMIIRILITLALIPLIPVSFELFLLQSILLRLSLYPTNSSHQVNLNSDNSI